MNSSVRREGCLAIVRSTRRCASRSSGGALSRNVVSAREAADDVREERERSVRAGGQRLRSCAFQLDASTWYVRGLAPRLGELVSLALEPALPALERRKVERRGSTLVHEHERADAYQDLGVLIAARRTRLRP